MKIAVALKWVADLDSVDVDAITGAVDASRLLYVLDPGAESALASALRFSADGAAKAEIFAYTVGGAEADPAIRLALAQGVTRAVRLDTHGEVRPAVTAAALAQAMTTEGPFDLILLGTRSFDRGSGEVPSLLASELGLPIVTDVAALKQVADDGETTVWELERDGDRGTKEIVRALAPAVLALGPDVARLGTASLPNFMTAQRAVIDVRKVDVTPLVTDPLVYERTELPLRPRTQSIRAQPPAGTPAERLASIAQGAAGARTRGKMVEGTPSEAADAIVTFLRDRGLLDAPS